MRELPHQSDFDSFAQQDFTAAIPSPVSSPTSTATLLEPAPPSPTAPLLPPEPPRPKPSGISPAAKWGLGFVVGVIAISVGAFAVLFGQQIASLTTVENLSAGACIENHFETTNTSEGDFFEILFVSEVDCTEMHAYEAYAVSDLWSANELHPGVEGAFSVGESFCFDQYNEFVGGDYLSSPYDFFTFVPSFDAWNEGDRTVQCLVGFSDGTSLVSGTLAGAGDSLPT